MARFFPDSGALFLHVPRTGGTFIEDALTKLKIPVTFWTKQMEGVAKKHSLLSHYRRRFMPQVEFVFAFVRHPVAYYSSTWRYLHDSRMASRRRLSLLITKYRWHPFRQVVQIYKPNFCEWAEAVLEREPGWATRLVESYVGPEDGEFCDYVGRTETLIPDLTEVLVHLGHDVDEQVLTGMGRVNSSMTRLEDVPAELLERICREERVLIRRFYSEDTLTKRWFRSAPRRPENTRLLAPGVPSNGP